VATLGGNRYRYTTDTDSPNCAKVAESGLTQRPAEPPIAGSNPALGFFAVIRTLCVLIGQQNHGAILWREQFRERQESK
jgi:hypothetical protein